MGKRRFLNESLFQGFVLGIWFSVHALILLSLTITTDCLGDVNQDGKLSISDMAIIKSHILGNSEMTYEQMDLADVNQDTHIDVVDIMQIRRHILGTQTIKGCK